MKNAHTKSINYLQIFNVTILELTNSKKLYVNSNQYVFKNTESILDSQCLRNLNTLYTYPLQHFLRYITIKFAYFYCILFSLYSTLYNYNCSSATICLNDRNLTGLPLR